MVGHGVRGGKGLAMEKGGGNEEQAIDKGRWEEGKGREGRGALKRK